MGRTSGSVSREVKIDGECLVHDPHQQRGGPLQTKRHHVPLELAQPGQLRPKARLPPVRGPHPQQMITTGQIELGEKAGSPRAVEQRVDVRERLDHRARDRVEAPVVVADAPRPVRLARENHRRTPRVPP